MHDTARTADADANRIDAITAQAFATDWATLGTRVLEAATIATAKHLAGDARRFAQYGTVVEPPKPGVPHTT